MEQRILFLTRHKLLSFLLVALVFFAFAGIVDLVERHYYGVQKGVKFNDKELTGYLEDELLGVIKEISFDYESPPKNATINKQTGDIIPAKPGVKVMVEPTVISILGAPENSKIVLVTKEVIPKYTEQDLILHKTIASYADWINSKGAEQRKLKAVLREVNNTLILPGESAELPVNLRTDAKLGKTFDSALKLAGLGIDQNGQVFNSTDAPVLIKSEIDGSRVIIRLLSK